MEYKKRLKTRLYIAFVCIALGIMMISGCFVSKTNNDFISAFGLAMVVVGLVRIRNYRIITKSEDRIKKQQIIETDERNLSIMHKAKSTAFSVYVIILSVVVIALSFCNMHEAAKWISYSVLLLFVIYWICYFIYRKKS